MVHKRKLTLSSRKSDSLLKPWTQQGGPGMYIVMINYKPIPFSETKQIIGVTFDHFATGHELAKPVGEAKCSRSQDH